MSKLGKITNRLFLAICLCVAPYVTANDVDKPAGVKAASSSSQPQTACPHANIKSLKFKVEKATFRVTGRTTVKTVYATLSRVFPQDAQKLALAVDGKPGWFHLTDRAGDQKLANEYFLCAFHRTFGVALTEGMSLSLEREFKEPNLVQPAEQESKGPSLVQPAPGASLFEKLRANIAAPPALEKGGSGFALTTEIEIGKIKPLLSDAPPGIFVTIGGDRAFRGAALLENITGLLIFDVDLRTVRFNQINAKLLKAKNLEQYRYLRWTAPFAAWRNFDKSLTMKDFEVFRQLVIRSALDASLLALSESLNRYQSDRVSDQFIALHTRKEQGNALNRSEQAWYSKVQQTNNCAKLYLSKPQHNFLNAATYIRYKQGNYLFDEELFQRLKKLAIANRIFSVGAQLADTATQDAIFAAFNESGEKISVLDLDNGYLSSYIGSDMYARLVRGLLPSGTDTSRLIAMSNTRTSKSRYAENQACSHSHYNVYLGFTFDYLHRQPSVLSGQKIVELFRSNRETFNKNDWQDILLFR